MFAIQVMIKSSVIEILVLSFDERGFTPSIWSTSRHRPRGIAESNDLSEIERIEDAADCV